MNVDSHALAVESACKNLVAQAAFLTDRQDHEAFVQCFAVNGELTRPGGQPLVGRDAILASYRGRPADRITRHLVTNTFMTEIGPDYARAISYVLLWSTSTEQPEEAFGRKANARQVLGEFNDRFELTDEGWRIAQREASFVMYTEQ